MSATPTNSTRCCYIEEKFQGFLNHTFPDAARMDLEQRRSLRAAFFGGVLISLRATCSTEDLQSELCAFYAEMVALGEAIARKQVIH